MRLQSRFLLIVIIAMLICKESIEQTHSMWRFDFPEVDDLVEITPTNFGLALKKFHYIFIMMHYNNYIQEHDIKQELVAITRSIKHDKANSVPIGIYDYSTDYNNITNVKKKYGIEGVSLVIFINSKSYVYEGKQHREDIQKFQQSVKKPKSTLIRNFEDYSKFVKHSIVSVVYFGNSLKDEEYLKFIKYRALFPQISFGHVFDHNTKAKQDLLGNLKEILITSKYNNTFSKNYGRTLRQDPDSKVYYFINNYNINYSEKFHLNQYSLHNDIFLHRKNFLMQITDSLKFYDDKKRHYLDSTNKYIQENSQLEYELLIQHDFFMLQKKFEYSEEFIVLLETLKNPVTKRLVYRMKLNINKVKLPLQIYAYNSNYYGTFVKYKLPLDLVKNPETLLETIKKIDNSDFDAIKGYRYYMSAESIPRSFYRNSYELLDYLDSLNSGIHFILFFKESCPYAQRTMNQLVSMFKNEFRKMYEQDKIDLVIFDQFKNEVPTENKKLLPKINKLESKLSVIIGSDWTQNWHNYDLLNLDLQSQIVSLNIKQSIDLIKTQPGENNGLYYIDL